MRASSSRTARGDSFAGSLAFVGFVVSALVALAGCAAATPEPGRDTTVSMVSASTTAGPEGSVRVPVAELEVGDCFVRPTSSTVKMVQRAGCDDRGAAEVFAEFVPAVDMPINELIEQSAAEPQVSIPIDRCVQLHARRSDAADHSGVGRLHVGDDELSFCYRFPSRGAVDAFASRILTGEHPSRLYYDAGSLWALSGPDAGPPKLSRFDPSNGDVIETVDMDPEAPSSDCRDLIVDDGFAWITDTEGGRVVKIDVATGELVDTIDGLGRVCSLVSDGTYLWVNSLVPTPMLSRIEITTGDVMTQQLASPALYLAYVDGLVWFTQDTNPWESYDPSEIRVAYIEPTTFTITLGPFVDAYGQVLASGDTILILHSSGLSEYDPDTGRLIDHHELAGLERKGMVCGDRLWYITVFDRLIGADLDTGEVTAEYSVGHVRDISIVGGGVWVVGASAGYHVIDATCEPT